jgi:hypothetical protein
MKLTFKCVYCKSKKILTFNPEELPFCDCGGIMLLEKAEVK